MVLSPLTRSKNIYLLKVISAENMIEGLENSFNIDITEALKRASRNLPLQMQINEVEVFLSILTCWFKQPI